MIVTVPRLRLGRPLWLSRRSHVDWNSYRPLRDDLSVDVAIVGGDITGAALAWHFAEAGVRVALLEGTRAGRGSTAASNALLMQELDKDFTHLARRYGRERARRIWELSRGATRDFIRTVQRLRIRCDLRPCDSVYDAPTPEHVPLLRREHA
jgi:gamma-glutamylputrescine oxidase